jgi:hypothetical protein
LTGRQWRWSSDAAVLRVHHGGHDVQLHVRGESPARYFDAAPRVTIRAGAEVVAELAPFDDFDVRVRVPAAVLDRAAGEVTIVTDRVFVPAEQQHSADRRRLGLRIWECTVSPVG